MLAKKLVPYLAISTTVKQTSVTKKIGRSALWRWLEVSAKVVLTAVYAVAIKTLEPMRPNTANTMSSS